MANRPEAGLYQASPISGGLVTYTPAYALQPDQSPDCLNCDPSSPNGALKRNGFIKFTNPANPGATGTFVSGLFAATLSNGTTYVLASEGTKLYNISAGNWNTAINGATITVDTPVRMVMFNDLFIIFNQGGGPYKWNNTGDAAALGGTPPANAKGGCVHKNRVFAWGTSANPSRLYYCALGNPENWTATNDAGYIDINIEDGMTINGVASTGESLIISKLAPSGKEGRLYVLLGNGPFEFTATKRAEIGAVSQEAMAAFDGIMTVASYRGIYVINIRNISELSRPVLPTFDAISDKSTIAVGRYKNQLWWAYTASGSTNNGVLILDIVRGVWSKYNGYTARQFATHPDGRLLFGSSTTTELVWEANNGTNDDGAAISFYWVTPDIYWGSIDRDKIWKLLFVHMKNTGNYTVTVEHYLDGQIQTDAPTVAVQPSPSAQGWRIARVVGPSGERQARFIRFKISQSTINQPIELRGFTAYADVMELSRNG